MAFQGLMSRFYLQGEAEPFAGAFVHSIDQSHGLLFFGQSSNLGIELSELNLIAFQHRKKFGCVAAQVFSFAVGGAACYCDEAGKVSSKTFEGIEGSGSHFVEVEDKSEGYKKSSHCKNCDEGENLTNNRNNESFHGDSFLIWFYLIWLGLQEAWFLVPGSWFVVRASTLLLQREPGSADT